MARQGLNFSRSITLIKNVAHPYYRVALELLWILYIEKTKNVIKH